MQGQGQIQGHLHEFNTDEVCCQSDCFAYDYEGAWQSSQMASMLTTPECVYDCNWYPDSGATNHLTADPDNLIHKANYFGPEQVHMGNGKGLQIKSVGHSVFHSPFT